MNFRDTSVEALDGKYLSKRVMVNGQFVTLYSANGQTWVSSPEDLPDLMDRLENARITLNTAEKVTEGESKAVAKPEGKPGEKVEEKAPQPKFVQPKYRMKGPKPRPILRQGGIVIQGTPIEPISASNTLMSFSSDLPEEDVAPEKEASKSESKNSKKARGKELNTAAKAVVDKSRGVVSVGAKAAKKGQPVVAKGKGKATDLKVSDKVKLKAESKKSAANKALTPTAKKVTSAREDRIVNKSPQKKSSGVVVTSSTKLAAAPKGVAAKPVSKKVAAGAKSPGKAGAKKQAAKKVAPKKAKPSKKK